MKPLSSEEINKLKSDKGLASVQVPIAQDDNTSITAYQGLNASAIDALPTAIDAKTYENYKKYGVTLNLNTSEEEANKLRAKNQGALEQVGRAVGQVVANEIVLGSVKGFSDIIDGAYNAIANDGYNDYTNPISEALETAQDSLRERWEIYEKDPNATFAFNDLGYLLNGATTIASTLSLLIPARGITGAAGAIGKLKKANKALKYATRGKYGMGKMLTKLPKNNMFGANSVLNGAKLEEAVKLGTDAFLMRTAENYQEARGVYKDVYDSAKERWETMDEKTKERVLLTRPDFANKTSDEVAKIISSESATNTYWNDMWLFALDAFQLKSLTQLYKGVGKTAASATLRATNTTAAMNLTAEGAKQAGKIPNILRKAGESFKYLDSPMYAELSEGFEEAWQGVQTEKGKEYAKKVLNPNYKERNLSSYLTDPEIWDQAFWGYIGGVGFQTISQGTAKVGNKITNAWKKHRTGLTDEVVPPKLTYEKLREQEIQGRAIKINELITDLSVLENDSKNPYSEKVAADIHNYKNYSSELYGQLDPVADKETIKEMLINDFVTDITLSAVEVGNEELLIEYLKNPYFNKYINQTAKNNLHLDKAVLDKVEEVKNQYYDDLWKISNTIQGDNADAMAIVAREITRNKFRNQSLIGAANNISTELNNLDNNHSAQEDYDRVVQLYDYITTMSKANEVTSDNFNISKQIANIQNAKQRNYIIGELSKIPSVAESIANYMVSHDGNRPNNDFILNEVSKYIENTKVETKEALATLIARKNDLLISAGLNEVLLDQSDKELQDRYNEILVSIDKVARKRLTEAYDKIKARALEFKDNPNVLFDLANNSNSQTFSDLQSEIELLNIGFDSGVVWQQMIAADLNAEKIKDTEIANTSEVNGEPVTPGTEVLPDAIIEDSANFPVGEDTVDNIETNDEAGVSSTGEEILTDSDGNIVRADVIPPVVEDLPQISEAEAKAIEDADAEYTAAYNEQATIYTIRSLTVGLYKRYKDLYKPFLNGNIDTESEAYKDLRSKLDSRIADYHIDSDTYAKVVDSAIAEAFTFISKNQNKIHYALTSSLDDIKDKKIIEDFIDDFVKKYNIPTNKKGFTYIDLNQLFDSLLNDPNIGFNDARLIYMNISNYVDKSDNSAFSSKYKFINKNSAYKGYARTGSLTRKLNSAAEYLNKLIANKVVYDEVNYIEASAANDLLNSGDKDVIIKSLEDGDELIPQVSGNVITLNSGDQPIGLLATVEVADNGSTLQDRKRTGLSYRITKTNNGRYVSNFDKVLEAFINGKATGIANKGDLTLYEIMNIYLNNLDSRAKDLLYYKADVPSSIIADQLLNNELIKELIDSNYIRLTDTEKSTPTNQAVAILRLFSTVIQRANKQYSLTDKILSLKNWIQRVYENYSDTYDIQNAVQNNTPIRLTIQGLDRGAVIKSNTPQGIGTKKLHFNYEDNPIIGITDGGVVQVEGSNTTYPANGLQIGTIGLLVRGGANPVYALASPKFNNIDKKSKLGVALKQEVVRLIKDRLNGESFDEFVRQIKDLYGGKGSAHNNLFGGFNVVYAPTGSGNNAIGLQIKGTKKYTFVAYRYRSNSTQPGTGITVYDKNGIGKSFTTIEGNDALIEQLAEAVLDNTIFNRTYLPFREAETNGKLTYYTTKNGPELNIKLGDTELSYKNYTDFAIQNNIFDTNQGVDDAGNYFIRSSNRFYVKKEIGSSPVEGTTPSIITPEEIFTSRNPNAEYDTKTILKKFGIKEALVKQLMDYQLLPVNIRYRRSGPANIRGVYNENTGKVSVFNAFVSDANQNPRRAITILMHEQFHKYFEESGYRKRNDITNELIDIYDEFIEAINKEPETYSNIIKWIAANNFTLEGYINNLPKSTRTNLNENELRQRFAEEWLVESLSQEVLLNALNNIKSTRGDSDISDVKPSLFRRIIDNLLKLFGINIDNIENNSILAREYKLLSDEINTLFDSNDVTIVNTDLNNNTDDVDTSDEAIAPNEDPVVVSTEINEAQQEEYDTDFDMFEVNSLTSEIDTNETKDVNSIRSLIETYDEREQPEIARFVANGGINFRC